MHLLSLNLKQLHLFGSIESGATDFDPNTAVTSKEIMLVLRNLRDEVVKKIISAAKRTFSCIIVVSNLSITAHAINWELAELINIALHESLKHNLKIEFFLFTNCGITPCAKEFNFVLQSLQTKIWQQSILRNCGYDDDNIKHLVQLLTSAGVISQNVDFSGNLLTLESANDISKLISGCQVENLHLNENLKALYVYLLLLCRHIICRRLTLN